MALTYKLINFLVLLHIACYVIDQLPYATGQWSTLIGMAWGKGHQVQAKDADHNFFRSEINKHGEKIRRNELDMRDLVGKSRDESEYRWTQKQRAHDVEIYHNDTTPKQTPILDWASMIDSYWVQNSVAPTTTLQLTSYHHFIPKGRIASAMSYLHLRIPYNITDAANHLMTVCACYDQLRVDLNKTSRMANDHQHEAIIKGLAVLPSLAFACEEAKDDIMEIIRLFDVSPDPRASRNNLFKKYYDDQAHLIIKNSRLGRKRRQILTGLALALAGAVAGGIGGFDIAAAISGKSGIDEQTVHKVNAHSHDLQLTVAHAKAQDKVIEALKLETRELYEGRSRANLAHKIDTCHMHTLMARQHFNKVRSGLRALYLHELPFEFISMQTLEANLPELKRALRVKGLELVVEHPADLYLMKTSWAVKDGEMNIFVHIPISPIKAMSLYEFVPTPFYSKQLGAFYIYDLDHTYLAMEDSRAAMFRSFSDMIDCTELHDALYVCPGHNVLRTDHSTSCLMAIYNGDHKVAQKLCSIKKFLPPTAAFQLAPNDFAFFASTDTLGDFECQNTETQNFRQQYVGKAVLQKSVKKGITIVELPNHCTFRAGGLTLNAETISIRGKLLSIKVEPMFRDAMVVAHIAERSKKVEIGHMDIPELLIPGEDMKQIPFHQTPYVHLLYSSGMGVLIIIVACFGLYCCLRLRRMENHTNGPSTNINIGQDEQNISRSLRNSVRFNQNAESVDLQQELLQERRSAPPPPRERQRLSNTTQSKLSNTQAPHQS